MSDVIDPRCFRCALPDCRQDSAECAVYGQRTKVKRIRPYKSTEALRAYNREYKRKRRAAAKAGVQ